MAYTITKSDGTVLTTIADGTRDTTTSLSLAGPNFVGYGQYLNENLVYLLENFAGNSAPSFTNLEGQLWFDKYNQTLKVFTTQGYVPVSGVTNSGTQPQQGKNGDIWYNSSTEQMFVYDSANDSGFKLVGPNYTRGQGISGAIPQNVEDASISGSYHNILKLQFGDVTYATVSADTTFLPSPPIPGFTTINPGITFSSNVVGPTINANIVGSITGSVVGNLTGNVVATTLAGNLNGNVVGNLTGNVVATTLSGNLTGNANTTNSRVVNFSSGNVAITGGYINSLANISATIADFATVNSTTSSAINFSSGNAVTTGGSATGLTTLSAATAQANNFSSSNILVTGGSISGATNIAASTVQATNFSSSNVLITGGSISGTIVNAGSSNTGNLTTANAQVTGGSVTGLSALSATVGQITNLSSANAIISSGNVSGVVGVNNTFISANVANSIATTKLASDKTTSIATTAFVHSVAPTGIIVMWNSTAATIPTGWQLCNGSNGTPDLRGQFIVGAGGAYNPADTGGTASVTLDGSQMPQHNHAMSGSLSTTSAGGHSHTISDPGHAHSEKASGYASNGQGGGGDASQKLSNLLSTTTGTAVTGISVNSVVDHAHSVTLSGNTGSTGGSGGSTQPHENRPPYYALCYIQKMY